MDVSGENSLPSSKVKHRFYQWATKWCYGSVDQTIERPDVASLVCLLQAIGCQLREFDKNDETDDKIKQNSIKMTIECGSSRMKAVLELDDVDCRCQTKDDVKDASFWSISGTARMGSVDSVNKFEETGSTLLPQVSKDNRAMMHDILYRLLDTIDSKGDINQNRGSIMDISLNQTGGSEKSPSDKSESITRSNTQPEIYRTRNIERSFATPTLIGLSDRRMSISAQNIAKLPYVTRTTATPEGATRPVLQRQKTWDLETKNDAEPRPSPPKISSSPVVLNDLCSSLDQVSLQSEGEGSSVGLTECLKRIQVYANRALSLCGSPSRSKNDVFLKPAQPKPKISPTGSRPSSACSSPATVSTKNTSEIHKPLARRSIGLPLGTKQMTVAKVTPSKLPPRRKSMGNNSQPALKMAVAGAQRAFALKKSSMKSQTSTSNSSLSSTETRVMLSAKRRVSPDPKSMSPLVKPAIPQLKTLTPKPLLNKSTGGSATPGNSSGIHKLSTPRASASGTESDSNQKRSVSPNPGVKRATGTGGGSRLSILKKDK